MNVKHYIQSQLIISVLSLVHACVAIVAALAGEIAICWVPGYLWCGLIYYVSSSLTYYTHVTVDSDQSCSPHDDESTKYETVKF